MRSKSLFLIVALGFVVASCGGEAAVDTQVTEPSSTLPSESVATTAVPTPTTSPATTAGATTTAVTTPSTTADPQDSTTTVVAGGPIDFGPRSGDVLAVIGVQHDDTLNLRSGPGTGNDIVGVIDPTTQDLVALGETWQLPGALWIMVEHEGQPGWVHMGFVAYQGNTDDVTAAVVASLGGYPTTASMEDLGMRVAGTFISVEPPSEIVMAVAPAVGDIGEVTYDVVGLGDDAVAGVRLHVFGAPTTNGFSLESVELTDMCTRGVTQDGLCV